MRSKLFAQQPKRMQLGEERWIRVMPDTGEGYALFDALLDSPIGRILVDADDNWIYDGVALNVYEQEDVAAFITGSHKEMNDLIRQL